MHFLLDVMISGRSFQHIPSDHLSWGYFGRAVGQPVGSGRGAPPNILSGSQTVVLSDQVL
jgi:hypothetical protein